MKSLVTTASGATYLFDWDANTVARSIGRDGNDLGGIFDQPLELIDFDLAINHPIWATVNTDQGMAWVKSTSVVSIEDFE